MKTATFDFPARLVAALVATALGLAIMAATLPGCDPIATSKQAGRAIIDCTRANQPAIGALVDEFKMLLVGQAPNWHAVREKAIAAGQVIGGCALAQLVLERSSKEPVPSLLDPAIQERSVLERFRSEYAGGAVFRLRGGDV